MNELAPAPRPAAESRFDRYYRWTEPDLELTVCLKLEMADRLQREVLQGMNFPTRGANEVGGILFGRKETEAGRTIVFVDDFKAIPCQHHEGSAYVLTDEEAISFAEAVEGARTSGPGGIVGYYRSHNRDRLYLSASDLRLVNRHFVEPDNVFLLVKTLAGRACTAGFFFWKDGEIQAGYTDSEAPLIPITQWFEGPSPAPSDTRAVDHVSAEFPTTALTGRTVDPHRRLLSLVTVTGTAAVLALAVAGYWIVERPHTLNQPAVKQPAVHPVPALVASPAAESPEPVLTAPPATNSPAFTVSRAQDTVAPQAGDEPGAAGIRKQMPDPGLALASRAPAVASAAQRLEAIIAPPVPVAGPMPGNSGMASSIELPAMEVAQKELPRVNPSLHDALPAAIPVPSAAPPMAFIAPRVIHQVTPAVPRDIAPMITSDVQVDVAAVVDAKGRVTSARIASTSGAAAGMLTIEALKAAQLFRFQPARENGRDVPGNVVLTFRFARTTR